MHCDPAPPLPKLLPLTTPARSLNTDVWSLLTKKEPLTPAEWAQIEALEQQSA